MRIEASLAREVKILLKVEIEEQGQLPFLEPGFFRLIFERSGFRNLKWSVE